MRNSVNNTRLPNDIQNLPLSFVTAENLSLNESILVSRQWQKNKMNTGTRTKGLSLFYIRSNICL